MKNFNLKKILSVLLACSIIMSIVQVPIFATDTADTSTSRGKVSMVYLGTGASPATTPQEVPDTSTWTADPTSGTTFWVGLCLSDLAKMDATASSGSDGLSSHFSVYQNSGEYDWSRESGIFNIASGIEYASKYIQPNGYVNDAAFKNKTLAMLKTLTPAYGSAYAGDDGAAISGDVSTNENREDLVISEEDSPKMAYFSISSSQSVDSKIFGYKDNINNDPIYIIAVNFKLVEMPTAGTKVLSAALNPENFLMQTGSATDLIWQGTWNKGRDIVPDNNLKNHIDYMGDLDLFPADTKPTTKYDIKLVAAGDINATFEVKQGTSTVSETAAGNKTYSLESGKNYTITAKASDGKAYKFDKWTSSDFTSSNESTYNPLTFKADKAGTLTANFKSNEYNLTVTDDNGEVNVYEGEGTSGTKKDPEGTGEYKLYGGETYTLSATAGTGYKFSNWASSEITSVNSQSTNPITFTMPTNNAAVTANFTPKTAPSITNQPSEYDKKTNQNITYTFDPGDYTFEGIDGLTKDIHYTVSGNTVTILATYLNTLTTGENKTFTFNFSESKTVTSNNLTISNSATETVEIGNVKNPTNMEYTYPETLNLDGLEFTVTTKQTGETDQVKKYKFEGTDWKTGDGYSNPTTDGITLKFNDTDTTVATQGMVMKQAQNGKAITIAKDGATSATTGTFTVDKKAITITSNLSANSVEKTYNGDNTVVDYLDEVKTSLTVNGAVGSDNISVDTNGVNATYNDENAADNKTINVTDIAISGTNTDEYTFNTKLDIENAGKITKANLAITAINNISPIYQYTQTLTGNSTATQAQFTSTDVVSGDEVTVSYNYEYTSSQTSGAVSNVKVTNITITGGADKDNYNLTTQTLSNQAGKVNAATIDRIEVKTQPVQTVDGTKATHGDTINLSALEITVHYVGGASNDFAYSTFGDNNIALTWTDGGAVTGSEELRHDTHNGKTITVKLNDKTATTDAFIVDKAVLTPSVSKTGDITKVYDNTNTVPDEEKAKITVTFDDIKGDDSVTATFDAVYAGVNVNTSETINITNIAPSGTDAENYTVTTNTDNSLTGAIKQRPLTVTLNSENKIPSIFQGDSNLDVTLTETTHFTVEGKVSGDDVTVAVTGTYESSDNKGDNIKVTLNATKSGMAADNYSLNLVSTETTGTVLANGVKTIKIDNPPTKTEYTHGDKLDLNGLEFTTTTNGGEEKQYKFYNDAWVSDGTYDGDPNASTDENEVSVLYNGNDAVSGTTVVRKDTANNSIIITGAAATESVALTVNAKELTPLISGSDIDKDYDGNANASEFAVTAVIKDKDTEVVTDDDVSINVVSAVYPDKDKDDAPVNLTVDYELTGDEADCYTLGTAEGNATGKINAKVVTVNVTGVDSIYVGATDLTADVTYTVSDSDKALMDGAGVTIDVTATYPNADASSKPTLTVDITPKDDANGNFTFVAVPATVTGEVENNTMESFVVTTEPKMTYEYGDKFDFTGTVIEVTYTDDSKKEFTYDAGKNKFVNGNEELEYTAKVTDGENIDVTTSTVDTADNGKTIEFTIGGITVATQETITVTAATLTAVAEGTAVKVYDGTTAVLDDDKNTITFKVTDKDGNVVSGVEVLADAVYASKDAGEVQITFSNIRFADETNSSKYTLPTEIAPITGTINKRLLTLESITVPSVKKGASATVTATNSTSFKLADTSLPIVEIDGKKDTVKISYTATYSSTATTGNNIAATIDNTTLAITADDNAVKNYEIAPFTGTATGTVSSGGSSGGGGGGGLAISISITKLNDETNEYEVVKDDLEGVVGDKITLGYEFSSNPANKEVEWLTSDEKIATVDENGVVTFVGEGEVEITVRRKASTSTKDTVTIKVTQPEATPTPEVTPEPTERPSLVDKQNLSPYIVGYEDGAFGPERTISREEVAAIFARLLVNKINMDENYEVSFSDIPDTAWSKNYIGFLEDFGILNGYEDGTYRPYNSITRAEMAVIIAKVEGYDVSGTDMTTKFSDVDSGYDSWATQSIKVLTEDGVIEGYEDGTFRPGNGITRAETVSMINRILDAMEVEDIKVRPTDVTDAHWAYEDIIKAMNDRVLKDVAISNSPNGETEEN